MASVWVYLAELLDDLVLDEEEGRAGWVVRGQQAEQLLEEERAWLGEGGVRDLTDHVESQALQSVLMRCKQRQAGLAGK